MRFRSRLASLGALVLVASVGASSVFGASCPTQVTFTSVTAGGDVDVGWTGQGHDVATPNGATVTVDVTGCAGTAPDCGVCSYVGPVENGPAQLQARRCLGDSSIRCTADVECGANGPCGFFFGSYAPFAAGGIGACVGSVFNGAVTGTIDVSAGTGGATSGTGRLTSRVFSAPTTSAPCPRCVGDGAANDGVASGSCSFGARNGLPCDANDTMANPGWGPTSLDCPPSAAATIAQLPVDFARSTGSVVRTLGAASPSCRAVGGRKCHCDTCNNAAASPCESNADCVAVGASICGGARCLGGANDGQPCSLASQCPGATGCGVPGAATAPNACAGGSGDCIAGDNAPATSADDRICASGPVDQACGPTETFRTCGTDADCVVPGDTCAARFRECFDDGAVGDSVAATGHADPPVDHRSSSTTVSLACVGATSSAALNGAVGLPSLARIKLTQHVVDNGTGQVTGACVNLPSDPVSPCGPSSALFNSWFEPSSLVNGVPKVDGVVKPADSVAFSTSLQNCTFYDWSEQMFLWATSPAPVTYGGGGHIFESPTFYDVSPEVNGHRTLTPHLAGGLIDANARVAPRGSHGFAAVTLVGKRSGPFKRVSLAEVVPSPTGPHGLAVVDTPAGLVEVARVERDAKGKRVRFFADEAGAVPIRGGKPQFPVELRKAPVVQKFIDQVTGDPVFVDRSNRIIKTEQGEAGGGQVLMTQHDAYTTNKGSLVYYGVHVNDVYAYFRTGIVNGEITFNPLLPLLFPVNQPDLNKVIAFAAAHGKTFADPNALAVELKTAWVRAKDLKDVESYITTFGTVPKYDETSPTKWTKIGTETVKLALIAMHVVGSAAFHPEMIWATFEHVCNAPNEAYEYMAPGNTKLLVPRDSSGDWLLCQNPVPAAGPFNRPHMAMVGEDIEGLTTSSVSFFISPSDTLRMKAWGAAFNARPNPLVATAAASNSDIIKVNNAVRGMLPSGDVRGNYIMTGATWTADGFPPKGPFGVATGGISGKEVGTSQLANATMETYQQGPDNLLGTGANCFACHSGVNPHATGSQAGKPTNSVFVSHIWDTLDPLF
jgi:hypothetical protein